MNLTPGTFSSVYGTAGNLGIAVGRRKLGKGQVITLGSTFWREARDTDRAFRAEESEGRRRAVEINNLFFSSSLAGRLVEDSTPKRLLAEQSFDLLVSEPVEFPLFTSSIRLTDQPGELVPVDPEQMTALPPIRTALKTRSRRERGIVPVQLHALTGHKQAVTGKPKSELVYASWFDCPAGFSNWIVLNLALYHYVGSVYL